MKIGVIGTGIMSSNIVVGFCEFGCEHSFILSPRNRERSAALAAKYDNVTVAKDNQDVLDNCEVVILSVLPQTAEGILSELHFRKDLKVISIIPILGLEKIRSIIGETAILVDVLPLPFISRRMGPIVQCPPNSEIEALLAPMGNLIVVNNPQEISVMRTITALMSPYYELIYSVVEWSGENGLGEQQAKAYTTSFFSALAYMASQTEEGKLKELAEEMTPGGLNWQAVNYLKEQGDFEHWQTALTDVMERVTGVKKNK